MCSTGQSSTSNRTPRPVVRNHEILGTFKGLSVLGIHSVAVALPILFEEAAEAGAQPASRPATTSPSTGTSRGNRDCHLPPDGGRAAKGRSNLPDPQAAPGR